MSHVLWSMTLLQRVPSDASSKAFTLVEILIVVAIIAALITVPFIAFGTLSANSRDNQRKADLNAIQSSMESYKQRNGVYPESLSTLVEEGYLAELPTDPLDGQVVPGSDGATRYGYEENYQPSEDGSDYRIIAPFENEVDVGGGGSGGGGDEGGGSKYIVLTPRGPAPIFITPGVGFPTNTPVPTTIVFATNTPLPTRTPMPSNTPIPTADCSYTIGDWVFYDVEATQVSGSYYRFTLTGEYPGEDDCLQKPAFGETGDPNTHYAVLVEGYDLDTSETIAEYYYMIGDEAVSFESITSTEIVISSTDPAFQFTQDAEYSFYLVQCTSSTYSGGICDNPTDHNQALYFYNNGWTNSPPVACNVCDTTGIYNYYFFDTYEEANTFQEGGSCGTITTTCFEPVEEPGPTVDGQSHSCAQASFRPCWVVAEESISGI